MMLSIKEDGLLVVLLLSFGVTTVLVRCEEPANMESEVQAPNLLGGWQERNPEEKEIQDLLPKVLIKLNQLSNVEYHLMPIKLLKVSSQVVAGLRYKMEIQVAQSECKKSSGEEVNLKTCKRLEGHPDQIITLEAWEKSWENFLQVKILEKKEVLSSV
uniref:Cystatin n=1 Tax=Acanthocheilonema viteae TaxID=6277 RepID=Q17108_ACAVI|nr:cystatin [Acanthocheilonema viteae]